MLSASDAADRADQLIAVTRRLTGLIDKEIQALKARRLDGASADWDEKERLAHAYRIEVSHLKANPSVLAELDPARRKALRDATLAFETAVESHAHALAAMKTVTEGLVKAIAAEIADARAAPTGYGRSGGLAEGARPESSGIAVNARA